MAFIGFGILSKKLLLIPGLITINVINIIVSIECDGKYNPDLINLEGEISILIIGLIIAFLFKPQNKKSKFYKIFFF